MYNKSPSGDRFAIIFSSHDTTTGDEDCGFYTMATATYGTLREFKPEVETITAYLERLKAYFDANDVPSAKRVAVLLSVIGPKTYMHYSAVSPHRSRHSRRR